MMGGSFSSAVGSGGPPRAAMGLGPPPWADLGYGGAYGGQRGSWLQRGGILPPLMLSSPSLRLHLLPLHHTNIGRV